MYRFIKLENVSKENKQFLEENSTELNCVRLLFEYTRCLLRANLR